MQRVLAVAIVVVVLLAFLIFLPAVRGRLFGIPLKWNYRVGQVADYNTTLDANYRFDVKGAKSNVAPQLKSLLNTDVPVHFEYPSHMVVRRVDPDGSAALDIAWEGGQMKTTVDGNETTVPLPRGKAITYTYDSLGNLLSTQSIYGSGPLQPMQLLVLASNSGCLSGRRTRLGAIWVAPLRFDLTNDDGHYTYEGKATDTLVGLETRHHTTVAHVHCEFKVRITEQTGGNALSSVAFHGDGKGTSECYIDYKQSTLVGYEVKAALEGALAFNAGTPLQGKLSNTATYAMWMQ